MKCRSSISSRDDGSGGSADVFFISARVTDGAVVKQSNHTCWRGPGLWVQTVRSLHFHESVLSTNDVRRIKLLQLGEMLLESYRVRLEE